MLFYALLNVSASLAGVSGWSACQPFFEAMKN
jgi:hypothetical protein